MVAMGIQGSRSSEEGVNQDGACPINSTSAHNDGTVTTLLSLFSEVVTREPTEMTSFDSLKHLYELNL